MHITRVVIQNYRTIRSATVEFRAGVTIVVGDNETGKSTLLEAIHAAVSGQLGGRSIRYQLHPFLFNRGASVEFARAVAAGESPAPPEILIEVYLSDDVEVARLKGTINTRKEDSPGISLRIRLDESCADDFADYVNGTGDADLVPVEFFEVEWLSFGNALLSARRIPLKSQLIDSATGDVRRGTGRYLSTVVGEHLSRKEQIELSLAYRSMKLTFERHPSVGKINDALLGRKGELSDKKLSVAMDMMTSSDWDRGVIPLLDDIPFELVGRGEQSAARIWLAVDAANNADIVMIEEPENHLSYTRLNALIGRLRGQLGERQLIVTTHSSFVVNKLGLEDVLLFDKGDSVRLTDLEKSTTNYFRKLPGHDTLRMVLAEKVILVEGPSDELVVQRAFLDKHGKRPIEAGVDVLCVRSLAFKRYLDIALVLKKPVVMVTDNDGDTARTRARYEGYNEVKRIKVCVSEDDKGPTLEPQIAAVNDLDKLRKVLGRDFADVAAAEKWMTDNKTEAAIRIHDGQVSITFPGYITDAIA